MVNFPGFPVVFHAPKILTEFLGCFRSVAKGDSDGGAASPDGIEG